MKDQSAGARPTGATEHGGTSETSEPALSGRVRLLGAGAGALAAGVALATGEVISQFVDEAPSPVIAVADVLVAETPGDLVTWSIETIGSSQQTILTWGVVIASLLVGAVLGAVAVANRWFGVAGFVVFGMIGGWAGARSATWSWFPSWSTALLAAATGIATLLALIVQLEPRRVADDVPADESSTESSTRATRDLTNRIGFLRIAGGALAWAVVAPVVGRQLAPSGRGESSRQDAAAMLDGADVDGTLVVEPDDLLDDVDGISSYFTPNSDFYLIDTALSSPQVAVDDWELRIHGMVDEETVIDFDGLMSMPRTEAIITLACVSNEVGGDLVGNARWEGVLLSDLLDEAGVRNGATQIVGRSVDGFTAGFPTSVGLDGRPAMVAVTMNGEPLPVDHGFPARLVVPGLYGYVSATKWLSEIELTTLEAFDAYWIERGWNKEGPIRTQSRIDVPGSGATVSGSPTVLAGVAWAPSRGIQRVEVRIDDGPWVAARLNDQVTDLSWRQWVLDQELSSGDHVATVRATDGVGETQTNDRSDPHPGGATGWHTVEFAVA